MSEEKPELPKIEAIRRTQNAVGDVFRILDEEGVHIKDVYKEKRYFEDALMDLFNKHYKLNDC